MALIVEDGTGKTDSNTYLSEAAADTYFARFPGTDWDGASAAQKDQALQTATQYLDTTYNTRWKGERSKRNQALDWPRAHVFDADDFVLDSDFMPQGLLDATAEAAERSLTEELIPDLDNPGIVSFSDDQVGPLRTKRAYQGGNSPIKKFRKIEGLIRGLVKGSQIIRG